MMSGIQGIIVCGEASESDEEEEFCIVQAQNQPASDTLRDTPPIRESRKEYIEEKQQQLFQNQFLKKRASPSLLHQKLWEANVSLEKNLSRAFQEPLVKKTSHLATLISSVPAAQTSTLTANSSFTSANLNLSHIDLLLKGLNNINAFETLKSQPITPR